MYFKFLYFYSTIFYISPPTTKFSIRHWIWGIDPPVDTHVTPRTLSIPRTLTKHLFGANGSPSPRNNWQAEPNLNGMPIIFGTLHFSGSCININQGPTKGKGRPNAAFGWPQARLGCVKEIPVYGLVRFGALAQSQSQSQVHSCVVNTSSRAARQPGSQNSSSSCLLVGNQKYIDTAGLQWPHCGPGCYTFWPKESGNLFADSTGRGLMCPQKPSITRPVSGANDSEMPSIRAAPARLQRVGAYRTVRLMVALTAGKYVQIPRCNVLTTVEGLKTNSILINEWSKLRQSYWVGKYSKNI